MPAMTGATISRTTRVFSAAYVKLGGWSAVARQARLREGFARLEPRRRRRWAEQQLAAHSEKIRDTEAQRQLRADDGEVDLFAVGDLDERIEIGQIGWNRAGNPRDSRVSWDADELADVALGRQPGGQGVLSRAAAKNQNPHCLNDLERALALHTHGRRPGTISLTLKGFAPRIRAYRDSQIGRASCRERG